MAWVYILRGASDRYYIGSTENLERRLAEHCRGSNHTTRRLGEKLELVGTKELPSIAEARKLETILKKKKNPRLAVFALRSFNANKEQPRKLSGLVPGSSPGRPKFSMKWSLNAVAMVACAATASLHAAESDLAATATNQLGIDLHRQLASGDENLCVSPYSIQSALAMTFAGSDGETRSEMARVLHFPNKDDNIHASFRRCGTRLKKQ